MTTQTTNEAAEAIKFMLDLWNRAKAAGLDPATVCDAFLTDGERGVRAVVAAK